MSGFELQLPGWQASALSIALCPLGQPKEVEISFIKFFTNSRNRTTRGWLIFEESQFHNNCLDSGDADLRQYHFGKFEKRSKKVNTIIQRRHETGTKGQKKISSSASASEKSELFGPDPDRDLRRSFIFDPFLSRRQVDWPKVIWPIRILVTSKLMTTQWHFANLAPHRALNDFKAAEGPLAWFLS